MRAIVRHVLVTPRNLLRVRAKILPRDQREAIRPGILLSHSAFTTRQGRTGFLIISHAARRAGICFEDQPSEWGRSCPEEHCILTDTGQIYSCTGERIERLEEEQ
jgi:hypothetical protein